MCVLGQVSIKVFSLFALNSVAYFLFSFKSSLCILGNSTLKSNGVLQMFSPGCGFPSDSLDSAFCRAEACPAYRLFLSWIISSIFYPKKASPHARPSKSPPM